MRLTRIVLTAIAALTVLAFVGASSAMAEPEHPEIVLCEHAELVCENPYPNPIEIHVESLPENPPKLLTSIGTLECEHSLAIVTLLNKLAKLVEGHLLALAFTGNCHIGSNECKNSVNALGGVSFTPGETKLTATIHSIELEGRNTNMTVKCGQFVSCTYSASASTELLAESDAEGHLLLLGKAVLFQGKGFLCPKEFKWDATYYAINLDEELSLKTGLWIEL